ncbi:MAG: hypothetical protein Q9157_002770 [Trypethelium eluteriae]
MDHSNASQNEASLQLFEINLSGLTPEEPLKLSTGMRNGGESHLSSKERGDSDLLHDHDNIWMLVAGPTSEHNASPRYQGQLVKDACVNPSFHNVYDTPFSLTDLLELIRQGHSVEINDYPTKSEERSEEVYSINVAIEDTRELWLDRAAETICSGYLPDADEAFFEYARSRSFLNKLHRAVLIRDILTSPLDVQQQLARSLVLIVLNLDQSHPSNGTHSYLKCDVEEILEKLRSSLKIDWPSRPKRDEKQITCLFRTLLENSGGRLYPRQHGYFEAYTASRNSDLVASVLKIIKTNEFGKLISESMCTSLSESPVFSGQAVELEHLHQWIAEMKESFPISYPEGYLVRHIQDSNGPILTWSESPIPDLGSIWCWAGGKLNILHEWASSKEGQDLYELLRKDFQDPQSVEGLSLTMVAMLNYRRFIPDYLDYFEEPIFGSFLCDLDLHFHGRSLGNSGKVIEHMVRAMLRKLYVYASKSQHLTIALQMALGRDPCQLRTFDRLSDEYLDQRITKHTHESAMVTLTLSKMFKSSETPEYSHLQGIMSKRLD